MDLPPGCGTVSSTTSTRRGRMGARRCWSRSAMWPRGCLGVAGGDGQPLLIGPDGYPDARIDGFFSSARMSNRAEATNRKYAWAIRAWLNFLLARGVAWDRARPVDVEAFKFWRRTDERNPGRVQGSTF